MKVTVFGMSVIRVLLGLSVILLVVVFWVSVPSSNIRQLTSTALKEAPLPVTTQEALPVAMQETPAATNQEEPPATTQEAPPATTQETPTVTTQPPPPLFMDGNPPPSKSICMAFRNQTLLTFTTNADRVRFMSIAAITHLGKVNLLNPSSMWKDEGGEGRVDFPVLSRAISDPKCEWVLLVNLNVLVVPSALQQLTTLLANAKGDVVVFHSIKSAKRVDKRVMAFRGISTPNLLDGVTHATAFEERVLAAGGGGASLVSISNVLKLAPADLGVFPFEVASMPRSVEACKAMVGTVFATFTPSTMPMSCTKLSPDSCWTRSCENSLDVLLPPNNNATVCIMQSEGDSHKSITFRPMNVLTWAYYAAINGYKLHTYHPQPNGRDRHLYRQYWTKVNLLIHTLQDPDCSWAMWADDDTLIMNPNVTLESIIAEYTSEVRDAMVIVSYENVHGNLNNGVFFMKRNDLGARFVMRWRYIQEIGNVYYVRWFDQGEMSHLFDLPEFGPYVVMVPQFSFNAYYVKNAAYSTFHPQKSLLLHYPGDVYNQWRAMPWCKGILNHHAIEVLGNVSRYSFCDGTADVVECVEKSCLANFPVKLHTPLQVPSMDMCVITPSKNYSQSPNMIAIDERQCPGCSFHALPDDDPHDGSFPTSYMLEVLRGCSWTIYPLDGCFGDVLSRKNLMALSIDVVVVMGEDSSTNSSATGFVAVRGGETAGVMFLKHYALFTQLRLSGASFPADVPQTIHALGATPQFAPQVIKVSSGGEHCPAGGTI